MKLFAIRQGGPHRADRVEVWDNAGFAYIKRIGGDFPKEWPSKLTAPAWVSIQQPFSRRDYTILESAQ